jgi:hypothetical protein
MPRGSNTLMPSAMELYRESGGRKGAWGIVYSKKGRARFAPLDIPQSFGMYSKRGQVLGLRVADSCFEIIGALCKNLEMACNGASAEQRAALLADGQRKYSEFHQEVRQFLDALKQ